MTGKPTHHSRFNFVPVESEGMLYDLETHNVIYLDASGVVVWGLCDGQREVDEIIRLIAEAYPEQREAIAADVSKTISTLAEQGSLVLL